MIDRRRVTVSGGGIAGLSAATALAQRGVAVHVAERADEIRETGAGIQISPNGMAVLDAIGLGDAVRDAGHQITHIHLLDGLSARRVVALDILQSCAKRPFCAIHRARLIALLQSAARQAGATIETGVKIAPPAAGQALPGSDLLIGADGLHSSIRAALNDAGPPQFTGQVAWRAIIPDTEDAPHVQVFMGPGRHLVSYPLGQGRRNIVAVIERKEWTAEGWHHRDDPAALSTAFARFKGPVPGWLERLDKVHLWGLFLHPVARHWFAGRQVVIGDAAHPSLPFLAQGANMALEDAWALSELVATKPVDEALLAFQELRKARCERIVRAASKNARNYHLSGLTKVVGHSAMRALGKIAPSAMIRQFNWLYGHDVTSMPP